MSGAAWVAFLVAAGSNTQVANGVVLLAVNVSGCFVLGVLTGFTLYHGMSTTTRTIIGTGGVGAYTTFSTFTFETVRLAEEGAINDALRYATASLVIGLLAAFAGIALAQAL